METTKSTVNHGHVSSTHPSLSLLVRGGVEQNPGPEFDQAMDKLYSRTECRLSQAEGQITVQTMEEMQRQINSVMKQQQRQSRDITQSLKNGHQSLHTEIQRVHTQVTHLSDTVEENRQKITNIAEDQCRTAEKLQKLESEIERLESFSRRNNLRFFNISQPTNETDDDCTRTLVRTLNQFYPLKRWDEDDIERAHRTGSTVSNSRRPRPIIARFFSWRDKMLVLRDREARRRMGDRDMRVADDLTNNQHTRLQKEREDGRYAYYKNGRLHTEVRQQNPNAARRVHQHEHTDNNLRGGSLRSSSRDARGDEKNEPHQGRYNRHNGPRHGGDDRTVYSMCATLRVSLGECTLPSMCTAGTALLSAETTGTSPSQTEISPIHLRTSVATSNNRDTTDTTPRIMTATIGAGEPGTTESTSTSPEPP